MNKMNKILEAYQVTVAHEQINESSEGIHIPRTIDFIKLMQRLNSAGFKKLYNKHTGTWGDEEIIDFRFNGLYFTDGYLNAKFRITYGDDMSGSPMTSNWFITFDGSKITSIDV